MVLDYRQLNKAINSAHDSDIIVSNYPLPNISDLLTRLGNFKIFSSLDLYSGYHHIGLKPEAQSKTVFATTSGKWQWNITPLGICSLPIIFSYLMSEVLRDLDFCFTYLDDILIFSFSREPHQMWILSKVLGHDMDLKQNTEGTTQLGPMIAFVAQIMDKNKRQTTSLPTEVHNSSSTSYSLKSYTSIS